MIAPAVWLIAILAAVLGYVFTWAVRYLAPPLGWVDRPDGRRKLHSRPTPLMGGVAFFAAAVTGVAVLRAASPIWPADKSFGDPYLLPLLASGVLFCLLGLYDDRRPLTARSKLLGQVLACLPFVIWGPSVTTISVLSSDMQLGLISRPLMLLWLICCVNAVNLLDGLDGLSASVGVTALSAVTLLAFITGNTAVAAVSLVCCGSLAGFLVHNWPPAKVFMGDAGSLTLGYLIGALSLQASLGQPMASAFTLPIVIVSMPLFDTLMAILRRRLQGRKVSDGDRAHIHHVLQQRGLNRVQTLATIVLLSMTTAVIAVASALLKSDLLALLMCGGIFGLLIARRIFGHVEAALLGRQMALNASAVGNTLSLLKARWRAVKSDRPATRRGRRGGAHAIRRT